MFKKIIGVLFMCVATHSAIAGTIISNATITGVQNTGASPTYQGFGINVVGTGVCSGQTIWFPVSATVPEVHKRAFTMAMTAFLEKKKITVHNYLDNTCQSGAYIIIQD